MGNDLVSIITPCYNSIDYIFDTIHSVEMQTYSNWEMIIVDDCSSDGSYEKLQKYCKKQNKIKLFRNKSNEGAAASRNKALCEAKGRWIAFLDSDDIWKPEKLEKQIEFMERNQLFFSFTLYEEIDEYSNHLNRLILGPKKVNNYLMKKYCWVGCLTVMYDLQKIGLIQIDPRIGNGRNDYALWLVVSEKADCYLLEENLAEYRKRNYSLSRKSYLKLIKYNYDMFKFLYKKNFFYNIWMTINNLFFGIIKKIFFVKPLS